MFPGIDEPMPVCRLTAITGALGTYTNDVGLRDCDMMKVSRPSPDSE